MLKFHNDPVPYITADNWFTQEDLVKVWEEIDTLSKPNLMHPPGLTGSATTPTGEVIKKNHGIFLDGHYGKERDKSFILSHFVRRWSDRSIKEDIANHHWFMGFIKKFNFYHTLLSYYEDGDNYLPHTDEALMTMVIHLYKEPKKFEGGDFCLDDKVIPLVNNRLILFPSIVNHSVTPVKFLEDNKPMSGNGRYTISHFLDYYSPANRK